MSKFYGMVKGQSITSATRRGTSTSGIQASVQSWDGSLISSLYYNQDDKLIINLSWNNGSSSYGNESLFSGTIEELKKKLNKEI